MASAWTTIGMHFEECTAHESRGETRLQKEPDFRDDFGKFEPGEAVIKHHGEGFVHGYILRLEDH